MQGQDQPAQFVPFTFNPDQVRAAAAAAPPQNPVFADGEYLATITSVTYGPGFNDPTSKQMKVHMTVMQSADPQAPTRSQTDYITLEGGNRFALESSQKRFIQLGDLFQAFTPTGMNATLLPGKQVLVSLVYKVKDKGPTNFVKSYRAAPPQQQPQYPQAGTPPAGLGPALPAAHPPYTPPAPAVGDPAPYAPWGGNPPAPAAPPQAPYPQGGHPPPPPSHVFTPPPSDGDF